MLNGLDKCSGKVSDLTETQTPKFLSTFLSEPFKYLPLLLIILFPIIQIALNRNIFIHIPGSFIDTWVYTGYFLSLPSHIQMFGATYYSSRLGWLLPGYLAHTFFPPAIATYILHLLFYYVLLIATYYLVKKGTNKRVAVLCIILMAWNPAIMMALQTDYVDGAGIVYILLSMLCLEAALTERRYYSRLYFCGIFIACAVNTNLFLIVFCPVFALHYWLRNLNLQRHPLVPSVLATFIGGIFITVLLGFANMAAGGNFLFFMSSVKLVTWFGAQTNPYILPYRDWIIGAYWLVLPMVAIIGAIIVCWRERRDLLRFQIGFKQIFQLDLILVFLIWLVFQLSGQPILYILCYASYLLPFAIIAFGIQLAELTSLNLQTDKQYTCFLAGLLCFLAIPFIFNPFIVWNYFAKWEFFRVFPENKTNIDMVRTIAAALFGMLVILAWKFLRQRILVLIVCLTGLGIIYSATFVKGVFHVPQDSRLSSLKRFEMVCNAHRFIRDHANGKKLLFWYYYDDQGDPGGISFKSLDNPLGPAFSRSLASTYLWAYSLLNEKFPSISKENCSSLKSNVRLVLILSEKESVDSAYQAMEALGVTIKPVISRKFNVGDIPATVALFDIVR